MSPMLEYWLGLHFFIYNDLPVLVLLLLAFYAGMSLIKFIFSRECIK